VAARHDRGDPPAVVLVDGRREDATTVSDTVIAIAGKGAIDYFRCPDTERTCGEVTLFSPSQSVYRQTALSLTATCQAVQLSGHAGFPTTCDTTLRDVAGLRSVPATKIYILASDPGLGYDNLSATSETETIDAVGIADRDLTYAQKVLADGWTGLSITPPVKRMDGSEIDITLGELNSCTSGEKTVKQQLLDADVPETDMKGSTITVVYVGRLLDHNGVELSGMRGATCPWSEEAGSIVLISWTQRLPTTLAHEFMHAIGPWQAHPWGHTNGVPGMNSQNILWGSEDPTTRTPRSLVTLGQAFRLSLDANSIFNRSAIRLSAEPSFVCQDIMSSEDSPCPRLTKDVMRP
jgi:hypothetical protein